MIMRCRTATLVAQMILGQVEVGAGVARPPSSGPVVARAGRHTRQRTRLPVGDVVQPVDVLVEQRLGPPAHGALKRRREVLVGAILA